MVTLHRGKIGELYITWRMREILAAYALLDWGTYNIIIICDPDLYYNNESTAGVDALVGGTEAIRSTYGSSY